MVGPTPRPEIPLQFSKFLIHLGKGQQPILTLKKACQLHTEPAEAYEALSRRPSAILSRSQTFEQSLPYSFVMECRAEEMGNKIVGA